MDKKVFTKNCELTVEDAIAWNNYYLENSPQWKKNWILIRMVFMPVMAACFIVSLIYLITSNDKGLVLSTLIGGGIGIIIGAGGFLYYFFYPGILKRRIRKSAHRVYNHQNNFIGNHKYTVSAEGISDNEDALVKWTAVEDIVQTDTHLFILVHPKKALIIPKRAFPDGAALNRFTGDVNTMLEASRKTG
jgi:hypothetical protein